MEIAEIQKQFDKLKDKKVKVYFQKCTYLHHKDKTISKIPYKIVRFGKIKLYRSHYTFIEKWHSIPNFWYNEIIEIKEI